MYQVLNFLFTGFHRDQEGRGGQLGVRPERGGRAVHVPDGGAGEGQAGAAEEVHHREQEGRGQEGGEFKRLNASKIVAFLCPAVILQPSQPKVSIEERNVFI